MRTSRRLHGFDTIQLALAVVALGILAGVAFAAKAYVENVRKEGVADGRKAALLEVAQRDNAQLAGALARVKVLEDEKDAEETAHRLAMQSIDTAHQEELARVHANKDSVIAGLRSGARRMRRSAGSADPGCPGGRGSGAAGVAGAAGERDAPARADAAQPLERANDDDVFTAGLLGEGDDAIVDLAACQAVLEDWRPRVAPPKK